MSDYALLLPEFMLAALAVLVLAAGLVVPSRLKYLLGYVSVLGLMGLLGFSLSFLWGDSDSLYRGVVRVDGYALFFKAFSLVLGAAIILAGVEYDRRAADRGPLSYAMVLVTVLGAMLMAASGGLLMAYASLELLSVGLYVLVSYHRGSKELATRYIIVGAFSSALLIYGIGQIYGLLGATRFEDIGEAMAAAPDLSLGVLIGLVLIIAGVGFKAAAGAFHVLVWGVNGSAPPPASAYLAVVPVVAAFALLLRLFTEALLPSVGDWQIVLVVVASLAMGFGNLVAPFQSSMIRLMAYSSVGQIGYLLLGVAALAAASEEPRISVEQSHLAVRGVLLQLVAFAVATTAAFLAITAFHSATGKQKIVDFAGMARLSPIMTAALAASLLSLAGVPILAGFVGKLYLFKAAWEQGLQWSVGLAILASLGSLYYFLRVVLRLYVDPSTEAAPIPVPRMTLGVLGVLLLGMVFLGVYPVPLVEAIEGAGNSLLSSEGVMRLLRSLD